MYCTTAQTSRKSEMSWFNDASFQELDHYGHGGAILNLGRKANCFLGMVTLRASEARHQW